MLNFVLTFESSPEDSLKFYIGSKGGRITIPRDRLTHHSPYLDNQVTESLLRGVSNRGIRSSFMNESPSIALTIILWALRRNTQNCVRDSLRYLERDRAFISRMIKVYLLSWGFGFHEIANIAIELLGRGYHQNNLLPSLNDFSQVYSHPRDWCLDFVAS